MFATVSPTCSPCGHVMQPVGPRTVHERAIGGAPVALWHGLEFECPACLTRTVLVDGSGPEVRLMPGTVGYERIARDQDRPLIPAIRVVWAEHLPAKVRRDSTRKGGDLPLSQRQQARRMVEDFFKTDQQGALQTLFALAELFELDPAGLLLERAASMESSAHTWEGGHQPAPRDAEGRIVGVSDVESYEDEPRACAYGHEGGVR